LTVVAKTALENRNGIRVWLETLKLLYKYRGDKKEFGLGRGVVS